MAKFLTTSGTSYYLEQLILNASSQLVLVTPFLQLSQNFIERLRDADHKGVQTILIYGKSQLKKDEWQLLDELRNIDIYFCDNLHAKCYHNDDTLIISSMNLYQFSQENNREMSILITKDKDQEVYKDACQEIQSIINASVAKKLSKGTRENKNGHPEEVSLNPDYTEKQNFHIPYLHRLLTDAYPDISFDIEEDSLNGYDQIVAKSFPIKGLDLQVDDRIFLLRNHQGSSIDWSAYSPKLYEVIPEAKIFMSENKLKFYWRERTNVLPSEQTLVIKANAYLGIINKVVDLLKN